MPISFIFIIFHGAPFICWLCFKARHFQIIRKPEYALRNVFFFPFLHYIFDSCSLVATNHLANSRNLISIVLLYIIIL